MSRRGIAQSQALGEHLKRHGTIPDRILTGDMKRQRQTALCALEVAGWDAAPAVDPGWDEFNATAVIDAFPEKDPKSKTDTGAFQRMLEKSSARWASGEHDDDYRETFKAFADRIDAALDNAMAGLGPGKSALVVSSSGAIAWAVTRLVNGGFPQWLALNRVTVNSGVTKIVSGAQGKTMVTYNDHGHLPQSWITYR